MLDLMVVHSRSRMNGQAVQYDGWVLKLKELCQ